jgi:hypothetical protein
LLSETICWRKLNSEGIKDNTKDMSNSNDNYLNNEFTTFDGGAQFKNEMGVKTLSNTSDKLRSLTCLYTNATSLNNKFDDLIEEINSNKADIVMISETWWTSNSVTNIKGYTLFRMDRRDGRGSGVCIYIKEDIKAYEVSEKCLNNPNVEQIWCVVELGLEKVLCGCIYRTGVSDLNNCGDIIKSIKYAHSSNINKKFTGVLICGDFNFHTIKWSDEFCRARLMYRLKCF